jgi:hypothetical protein
MNYTKLKQEYETNEQEKQELILNELYLNDLIDLGIEVLQ